MSPTPDDEPDHECSPENFTPQCAFCPHQANTAEARAAALKQARRYRFARLLRSIGQVGGTAIAMAASGFFVLLLADISLWFAPFALIGAVFLIRAAWTHPDWDDHYTDAIEGLEQFGHGELTAAEYAARLSGD